MRLSLFLIFLSLQSFAASFFCEETSQIRVKGINCCLTSINEDLCRKKINELPSGSIERVSSVQRLIAQGRFQEGAYPNCHWNALYEQAVPEALRKIDYMYPEVAQLIERDFSEITRAELKKGDLVAVVFKTEMREYNDETRQIEWSHVGSDTAHSALYIGDGMVFQKENAGNEDFSIQNLDDMLVSYQESYNSKPQLMRGVGSLKFYRKKI